MMGSLQIVKNYFLNFGNYCATAQQNMEFFPISTSLKSSQQKFKDRLNNNLFNPHYKIKIARSRNVEFRIYCK